MSVSPHRIESISECVDATIEAVGRELVIAIPLGIGKPIPLVNEFYRRAVADPTLKLKIYTALSLKKPVGSNDLERRFLEPFVARVFGDTPELDYVAAVRTNRVPANIQIIEFFLDPGAYLNSEVAQQHYLSANYTHVAREIVGDVNVIAQMVAARVAEGKTEISLSCNPDITLDLLQHLPGLRQGDRKIVTIAVVNAQLPFMLGDAEIATDNFDFLIESRDCEHDLFCPPNMPISGVDHVIGLYASSLVKDGGTLQLGIGELGDAIVYSLQLRHQQNALYKRALNAFGGSQQWAEVIRDVGDVTAPFEKGLTACTEMFVDGFLDLYRSRILKRRVYPHAAIQRGLNTGNIRETIDAAFLDWLIQCGVGPRLSTAEFTALENCGFFRDGVTFNGRDLVSPDGQRVAADFAEPHARAQLFGHCLAPQLRGGVLMHGGFFLGPKAFYAALRDLPDSERRLFNMTSVDFINQLYGAESALKILQRTDARFINTTMMVTLLGAAVSDGLDDGRVVSGVGGQYNFVSMAHALPGARSIIAVRSTRTHDGKTASNIVFNYGHTTIPRHLRDIVISEYGIADLRGKTDSEIIKALLNITDSRFQDALLTKAKAAGKISREYEIADAHRNNTPHALENQLARFRKDGMFADFPFGTDFTAEEIVLGKALKRLKERTATRLGKLRAVGAALLPTSIPGNVRRYLERMNLYQPKSFAEKVLRNLVASEIKKLVAESGDIC